LLVGVVLYDGLEYPHWRGVLSAVCWLSLVLIAGLRYQVGGDTLSYMEDYKWVLPLQDVTWNYLAQERYNALWVLLNAACKSISYEFVLLQMVHALFVNSAIFYFFKRYSKRFFTAVLVYAVLYFFFYNMEIMRASMAMAVFLFGFSTLEKKQWLRYLLVVVVAFGFHSEAIVMLILPICHWLGKVEVNLRNVVVILAAALVTMVVLLVLPRFTGVLNMTDRLSMFSQYIEADNTLNIFGKARYFLMVVPWLLVLLLCRDTEEGLLRGMLVLSIFFTVPMMEYHVLFSRMNDFLKPACIVCLSNGLAYYYAHRSEGLRVVKIAAVVSVLLLAPNDLSMGEADFKMWKRYWPYHSYLEYHEVEDAARKTMMENTEIFQ